MDNITQAGWEMKGFKEFKRLYENIILIDPHKFYNDELKWAGSQLVAALRANTPISTRDNSQKRYASRNHLRGTLRNSVGMRLGGSNIPVVWVSYNRKKSVDAWYNHIYVGGHQYGTSKVPPHPKIRETWEENHSRISATLKKRLQQKLEMYLK